MFGKSKVNISSNYIWNAIAGTLDAAEAVILSMMITRITGLNDAGILTIAFATANLFVTIGKYGVRSYQVTDQEGLSFNTYLYTRYVTVLLMLLLSAGYVINGIWNRNYSFYKAGSIFCISLIFAIEAIEDVYWGACQKANRLDIGAKMFIIRWIGILFSYFVSMLITGNLLISSCLAAMTSLIIFIVCKSKIPTRFISSRGTLQLKKVFKDCLPLCAANFLNYYICSAPKYAIDKYMDEETQACFGFVAMPVFVIGLLSTFLYAPILVQWSERWNKKETEKILRSIGQQILAIIGISIMCIGGAYLVGIPFLSMLYNIELNGYKRELIFMMSGGGILAIVNLLIVMLTIMRKQIYIIGCYGIVSLLAVICFPKAVLFYGTCGAAIMYDILISVLLIILGGIMVRTIVVTH